MTHDFIVVIATTGRSKLLHRTLESLSECRKPDGFQRVIIVENGPKGDAEQIVRSFHSQLSTRYMYTPQANKSHALNVALAGLKDCLIFFTDDDVRIHPETLCAYAEAASGYNGGQFYGGPVGVDYEKEEVNLLLVES